MRNVNAKNKSGATPLHVAMLGGGNGGTRAIPFLLKAKADVNALDNKGCTPLLYFVRGGDSSNLEKMKQLIDAGADVNRSPKNGVSPLHWAVANKMQMVDLLIAAGANVNAKDGAGRTPLHYAAQSGQSQTVELLLKAKGDPNLRDRLGWSPLIVAADNSRAESIARLRNGGATEPSWNNLHRAVVFGDSAKIIAEIAKDKPQVNSLDAFGRTPLYWALRCRDDNVADSLLNAGAQVASTDKRQKSILPVAAWARRADIVKKAIAAGENVNVADNDGNTALHFAAADGNYDLVQFLLEKGAKVNAASKSGETPLMFAVNCGKVMLVKRLLDAGADVLAADDEGKTIEDSVWKVFDDKTKSLLKDTIADAKEKRIDAICYLYSPGNPHALKADAIRPTTPNLAAVKMFRAWLGPDRKAFAAAFVSNDLQASVVDALYDVTQCHIAFRKELKHVYGPDACRKFSAMSIDGMTWSLDIGVTHDERCFQQMDVEVHGDRAVCHEFPNWKECGDVGFVKHGDDWRVNAAFLTPATQLDANLRLFHAIARCLRKGRECLGRSGISMEDVKRAMIEELKKKEKDGNRGKV